MSKDKYYKLFSNDSTIVTGVNLKKVVTVNIVTTNTIFLQPIGWNVSRVESKKNMLFIELEQN